MLLSAYLSVKEVKMLIARAGWTQRGGCPLWYILDRVWHQPRLQGSGGEVGVVIQVSLAAVRGTAPQVTSCNTLFLKLGSWEQLGLLLLCHPPSYIARFPAWTAGGYLRVGCGVSQIYNFRRFQLAIPGSDFQRAWEFMASMGLSQVIPTQKVASLWTWFSC